MSVTEHRFALTMRVPDSDEPGIVMHEDGTIWWVKQDGSEVQLGAGGGSSPTLHGCLVYLNNPGKLVIPTQTVSWDQAAYDVGGYLDPNNGSLSIPAGLGGIYLIEAVIYLDVATSLNPDLDRPTGVIDEPSDSCDIQFDRKNPDSNAPFDPSWWYGSGSFVRPLEEGGSADLKIGGSTSNPNGAIQLNGGTSQTMMTLTKLFDLPPGYVSPF